MLLDDTEAAIVERVEPGGIVYRFSALVRIDGQPLRLERYVCSQECFYEPWVVNGLRIWLDTVRDVFDLIPVRYPHKGNLQCVPRKAARFAVQDAALRICPEPVLPWIDHDGPTLNVGDCYNGDDCYLGPYLGQACHVGMDVNQAKGSLLFAPIRFNTQAYFNSLAAGDNNNRWRGIRRWPNGDVWALQSHHLIELLVPENTPLETGAKYATTAGVYVGSHQHTHFEFKIGRPRGAVAEEAASIAVPVDFGDESEIAQQQPEVLHLDPWILFWQAFEDQRETRGEIRAAVKPLAPARVGEKVQFSAVGSHPGPNGKSFRYLWFLGDTGMADGPVASYVFSRPGVFPVRLIVDDGVDRDSTVQWIAISGSPLNGETFTLRFADEPSFRPWRRGAAQIYGEPVRSIPRTMRFVARPTRPKPATKSVSLKRTAGSRSTTDGHVAVKYEAGAGWLRAARRRREGDTWLEVSADATGLEPGTYAARVDVSIPKSPTGVEQFRVELDVCSKPPQADVTVDDADPGFQATPYSWVGHRFCRCPKDRRGYGGFYLTNGGRAAAGEFARFTPDLQAGRYRVSLQDETPYAPDVEFDVRVRHAKGEEVIRMRPAKDRSIGTFQFEEGTDGFAEILTEGSKGLVIADAVHFGKE